MYILLCFPIQGVVAEATLLLDRLKEVVKEFHRHGLFLFTYGEVNNKLENYNAQKSYGLDGIILDDVARVAKVPIPPFCAGALLLPHPPPPPCPCQAYFWL
jgi:hypothetical protein